MAPSQLVANGESSSQQSLKAQRWGFGWRHIVCSLELFIVIICYADRTNIGIVLAQTDLPGIPHEDKGSVLSSFFAGYFCTQIVGGYIARRFGSKPTMLLAAAIWTFFDVLTPFAARLGLGVLIADRIMMGFGEGMMFPSQHNLTSFWVPVQERAWLITLMTSGQDLGSVMANLISPRLVGIGGDFPVVFAFWGCLTVLWFVVYCVFGASAPETHWRAKKTGEAEWIKVNRTAPDFSERQAHENPVPWRLIREPCVWAVVVGHMGMNYSWYVMLSWMPTFFRGRYDVDLKASTLMLCTPYLASWAGGLVAGRISDWMVKRGIRQRHTRKIMQGLGAVGLCVTLQITAACQMVEMAALWISIACFLGKLQVGGYWVNMVDIAPESAASVMGISNTMATIPGVVGQPITQALLLGAGGEAVPAAWHAVFAVGGGCAIAGAIFFGIFGDDRNLDANLRDDKNSKNSKAKAKYSDESGMSSSEDSNQHSDDSEQGTCGRTMEPQSERSNVALSRVARA